MKWIKRILLWTAIVLTLIISTGVIISYAYEDEVKAFVVARIAQEFHTPIYVEDIEFSVFSRFPNASVEFTNVTAMEDYLREDGADTLLSVGSVFLQFNLMDLFWGNYQIKKVQIYDGFASVYIDEDGIDNFHVWKTSDSDSAAHFLVKVEDVELENVRFHYNNDFKREYYEVDGSEVLLSGAFSENNYELDVDGNFYVHEIKVRNTSYVRNRKVDFVSLIDVDQVNQTYSFEGGKLRVDELLNFRVDGEVLASGLDLKVQGNNLDIVSTKALLTPEVQAYFDDYSSRGIVDFEADIKGAFSNTEYPAVTATFGIEGGVITQNSTGYSLENVSLQAKFGNGPDNRIASSWLDVERLDAKLGNGHINTKFRIDNLAQPKVGMTAKAQLDLAELVEFVQLDTIQSASGRINFDVNFAGTIRDPKNFTPKDFMRAECSGSAQLAGANLQLVGDPHAFRDLNGNFLFRNNDLMVQHLDGSTDGADFEMSGVLRNLLAYMFLEDQRLTVEAEVVSQSVDMELLLADNNVSEGAGAYKLSFPKDIDCNLKLQVEDFSFRRFRAMEVDGLIKLRNGRFSADRFYCEMMGGSAKGSLSLTPMDNGNFRLSTNSSVRDIDIHQLFYQFENFAQPFIRYEHLKGIATAKADIFTEITPELEVLEDPLVAGVDLTIEEGELIAFEPLQDVSTYLRTKKLLSKFIRVDDLEDNLKHIKFETLSNHIGVRNKRVTIPKMEVRSSAMDIEISGSQTFDNHIDYLLSFELAQIFSLGNKEKNDFVSQDEKGRSRIWLTMTGTVDDPEINLEKIKIRTHFDETIKQGTRQLAGMVKDEYSKLKQELKSPPKVKEEEKEVDFLVEWEEDPTLGKPKPTMIDTSTVAAKPKKKDKALEKLMKLMESDTPQEDFGTTEVADDDY